MEISCEKRIESSYLHGVRITCTCMFVSDGISSRFPRFIFNVLCISCRKNENVLVDLMALFYSPRVSDAFNLQRQGNIRIFWFTLKRKSRRTSLKHLLLVVILIVLVLYKEKKTRLP